MSHKITRKTRRNVSQSRSLKNPEKDEPYIAQKRRYSVDFKALKLQSAWSGNGGTITL